MNASITLEEIQSTLDEANIAWQMVDIDRYGFSRTLKFSLNGINYFIGWWCNVSYLSIGALHMNSFAFSAMRKDKFFPSYETGLQFTYGDYAFHVAIGLLDWQKSKGEQS